MTVTSIRSALTSRLGCSHVMTISMATNSQLYLAAQEYRQASTACNVRIPIYNVPRPSIQTYVCESWGIPCCSLYTIC